MSLEKTEESFLKTLTARRRGDRLMRLVERGVWIAKSRAAGFWPGRDFPLVRGWGSRGEPPWCIRAAIKRPPYGGRNPRQRDPSPTEC